MAGLDPVVLVMLLSLVVSRAREDVKLINCTNLGGMAFWPDASLGLIGFESSGTVLVMEQVQGLV